MGIVETSIIIARHSSLRMVATVLMTMRLMTLFSILIGTWVAARPLTASRRT
jgi:hypothetical protein